MNMNQKKLDISTVDSLQLLNDISAENCSGGNTQTTFLLRDFKGGAQRAFDLRSGTGQQNSKTFPLQPNTRAVDVGVVGAKQNAVYKVTAYVRRGKPISFLRTINQQGTIAFDDFFKRKNPATSLKVQLKKVF